MIEVTTTVVGAEAVAARFQNASTGLRERLRRVVQSLGLKVLAAAKERVSDDVLRVRSGKLRRSLHEETTDDGNEIRSVVGTNLVYARPQELGFVGSERVRAHTRTTARAIAHVKAFTRQMNLKPHPFLGPSLAERRAEILKTLQAAVVEGI